MSANMSVKIGASIYSGWKRIDIKTGIEQLAGEFNLSCSDVWAINGDALPLLPGLRASVLIYDQPVITGFIDDTDPEYDGQHHDLAIVGRDATGDLVDSAAKVDGQGWQGRTLQQIADDLCKPFGIRVSIDANIGNAFAANIYKKRAKGVQSAAPRYDDPFDCQQINPAETVFDVLSRAARLRGCLLVSDGLGGLHITTTGSARATRTLELGVDILKASGHNSHRERFNLYQVLGQQNEVFSNGTPSISQQIEATSTDSEIRTGRVTVIDPIDQIDKPTAQRLAEWAKANRKARGIRCEFTVRGWLDGKKPWQPNTLVRVKDRFTRFAGEYLIAGVNFALDEEGGELAKLTVTPPDAYVPQPDHETLPNSGLTP